MSAPCEHAHRNLCARQATFPPPGISRHGSSPMLKMFHLRLHNKEYHYASPSSVFLEGWAAGNWVGAKRNSQRYLGFSAHFSDISFTGGGHRDQLWPRCPKNKLMHFCIVGGLSSSALCLLPFPRIMILCAPSLRNHFSTSAGAHRRAESRAVRGFGGVQSCPGCKGCAGGYRKWLEALRQEGRQGKMPGPAILTKSTPVPLQRASRPRFVRTFVAMSQCSSSVRRSDVTRGFGMCSYKNNEFKSVPGDLSWDEPR